MSRYPRSRKQVRFNLPDTHNDQPPSILRRQTRGNIDLDTTLSQPSLSRRASLPGVTTMSRSSRLRGLEALHGLREYLKDACNFHGEEYHRALSVPSVDALCNLTDFISQLRGDTQNRMTHADEKVLHRLLNCSKRHPHEQLAEDEYIPSRHARNAIRAHRKRARREADFYLLQFVSRQLRLPARALRELSTTQRIQREMEAFKQRIMKFYGPRSGGNSSAPQSPAERPMTAPRSPATDPIKWEMLHGRLSGTPRDLFAEEMADLSLPDAYHSQRRTHPQRTPPQQPLASPYVPVRHTPPQAYQTSPYVYPGIPVGGYQRTPPQAPASIPYNTQMYGQQAAYQGQQFAPPPMNLPQGVGTPQQQQATMQGSTVPGMSIPPSMPSRQGKAPMGPTPHTPQQQALQHPAQPGHTQPVTTPQQQTLPQPQQTGMTLPPSQQQTPQQAPLPHPQQTVNQGAVHQTHLQAPVQNVPASQGFLLPVPTAVPAFVHTVPQSFAMTQPFVQGHGQYVSGGYPQPQQTGVGQIGQQYQSVQGQYGQGYYGHSGAGPSSQRGTQQAQQQQPQQQQK